MCVNKKRQYLIDKQRDRQTGHVFALHLCSGTYVHVCMYMYRPESDTEISSSVAPSYLLRWGLLLNLEFNDFSD